MTNPLSARLRDAFFAPSSPVDLAAARILVYGFVIYDWWGRYQNWDDLIALRKAVGMYKFLPFASDAMLHFLQLLGQFSALLCLLGIAFRVASIGALTIPYLVGFSNNFAKVDHGANLLMVAIIILAFSRADDALSLKAWWRKRRSLPAPEPSGDYRWPVRAIWLSIAAMYCSAGISKVRNAGLDWALSDNFQNLLLRHHFTHDPPTNIGVWLAEYPDLCQALALGALGVELVAPLLLLGGAWLAVIGGSLMALQLGIYVMLGVLFKAMLPLFLTFLPWSRIYEVTRDRVLRLRNARVTQQADRQ